MLQYQFNEMKVYYEKSGRSRSYFFFIQYELDAYERNANLGKNVTKRTSMTVPYPCS